MSIGISSSFDEQGWGIPVTQYSPQEFIDAMNEGSPEGASKAIYALQQALQKQQDIIDACRELETVAMSGTPDADEMMGPVRKISKLLKAYNKP